MLIMQLLKILIDKYAVIYIIFKEVINMNGLNLKDIIVNIKARCKLDEDIVITGVSTDTRTINKGDLFIALIGEKFDAHDYIDVAEKNGAAAVVCSRDVKANVPVLYVEDTLVALHRLATYYRTTLDIKVVAVTGSNGKTSTRDMTAAVLSTKYKVYSTAKNFNNEIGLPKSVLELDDSYDVAVLEMGMNHLGEISRLTNIAKPDIAMITNVGKAHIGNLGSQENILKAKLEITEGIQDGGLLILNGDDKLLSKAEIKGNFEKSFVGIGDNGNKSLFAKDIEVKDRRTYFTVGFACAETRGYIPVLGDYNVSNSLEAIRAGAALGVSVEDTFKALENYKSVGMRQEVENVRGIKIVKDYYNSSPDSARVALETLSKHSDSGNCFAILGEMLELGEFSSIEHFNLGRMCVKNGIEFVFFIGDYWEQFKNAARDNSKTVPSENREELADAIKAFVKENKIKEGDAVLVKGSRGMKMEEFYDILKQEIINNS